MSAEALPPVVREILLGTLEDAAKELEDAHEAHEKSVAEAYAEICLLQKQRDAALDLAKRALVYITPGAPLEAEILKAVALAKVWS